MEEKKPAVTDAKVEVTALEKFESAFVLPGFGQDAAVSGRVVEHVIAKTAIVGSPIHLKWVKVERGCLTIAGECEPEKLKAAVNELSIEVVNIRRQARLLETPLASQLPRSAEEKTS